jgi:hypothetical protein
MRAFFLNVKASELPVIQEFLESIHTSRLIINLQASIRRQLSEMMDRIAKDPKTKKIS